MSKPIPLSNGLSFGKETPVYKAAIFRGMTLYTIDIYDDESCLDRPYRFEVKRGTSKSNLRDVDRGDEFTLYMLIEYYVDNNLSNSNCTLQSYLNSTFL